MFFTTAKARTFAKKMEENDKIVGCRHVSEV